MPDISLPQLRGLISDALALADRLNQANVAIHLAEAQDALPKPDIITRLVERPHSRTNEH